MSWKLALTVATIAGGLSIAPFAAQAAEYGIINVSMHAPMHRHHRTSYGTGYRGRGTRTGGPVGGLPSKN